MANEIDLIDYYAELMPNDNFMAFAEGYLSLVNGNGHDIAYKIYKANEEEIASGKIQ